MVRTPHKGETAQNDAMQILLSIIIHKSFSKAINGRFCLQKRNKFHKQTFPYKVNSRSPAAMQTVKNKAGREKTDSLIKLLQVGRDIKQDALRIFIPDLLLPLSYCVIFALAQTFFWRKDFRCAILIINRSTFPPAAAAHI